MPEGFENIKTMDELYELLGLKYDVLVYLNGTMINNLTDVGITVYDQVSYFDSLIRNISRSIQGFLLKRLKFGDNNE